MSENVEPGETCSQSLLDELRRSLRRPRSVTYIVEPADPSEDAPLGDIHPSAEWLVECSRLAASLQRLCHEADIIANADGWVPRPLLPVDTSDIFELLKTFAIHLHEYRSKPRFGWSPLHFQDTERYCSRLTEIVHRMLGAFANRGYECWDQGDRFLVTILATAGPLIFPRDTLNIVTYCGEQLRRVATEGPRRGGRMQVDASAVIPEAEEEMPANVPDEERAPDLPAVAYDSDGEAGTEGRPAEPGGDPMNRGAAVVTNTEGANADDASEENAESDERGGSSLAPEQWFRSEWIKTYFSDSKADDQRTLLSELRTGIAVAIVDLKKKIYAARATQDNFQGAFKQLRRRVNDKLTAIAPGIGATYSIAFGGGKCWLDQSG